MFEGNMDEYLDEEVESVKHTLEVICKDWDREVREIAHRRPHRLMEYIPGLQLIIRRHQWHRFHWAASVFILTESSPSETQRPCLVYVGASLASDDCSDTGAWGWGCVDDGWECCGAGYCDA